MSKYRLLLIYILFFLLRIFFAYKFGWSELKSDSIDYNNYALAVLNKADWLINPNFSGNYRAPFYPLCLAVIYSIFGVGNFFAVYCFQAFLNTITIYYIFKLSKEIFGERISYLSLIWAGGYSFYFAYIGWMLREILICFLMICSIYHLWRFFLKNERQYFLKNLDLWIFIIAIILLIHTDSRYLFYIPFISILFLIYNDFKKGIKQYSILLTILILLLVPWTIRNYISYDGFVLIDTQTLDLRHRLPYFELTTLNKSTGDSFFGKAATTTGCIVNKDAPTEEERTLIKQGHNYNHRSNEEIDSVLNNIYPAKNKAGVMWHRFRMLWRPWHFINEYTPWPECYFDPKYSLGSIGPDYPKYLAYFGIIKVLTYGMLLPFMILALINILINQRKEAYILVLPIIVQTVFHVIILSTGRYRVPIDSFIIILGCYEVTIIFNWFIKKLRHD